jgi:hypothetical protein
MWHLNSEIINTVYVLEDGHIRLRIRNVLIKHELGVMKSNSLLNTCIAGPVCVYL